MKTWEVLKRTREVVEKIDGAPPTLAIIPPDLRYEARDAFGISESKIVPWMITYLGGQSNEREREREIRAQYNVNIELMSGTFAFKRADDTFIVFSTRDPWVERWIEFHSAA